MKYAANYWIASEATRPCSRSQLRFFSVAAPQSITISAPAGTSSRLSAPCSTSASTILPAMHLLHSPQGDLFDADAARSQQLQRVDVDAVECSVAGVVAGLLSTRQGNLTGEQLCSDEVRLALDLRWCLGQR